MGSTNKTTNLDLSQFVASDRPDWLTDYNSDMEKIDAWTATAESDISTATADASSAKTTAGNALSAINNTNTNIANWRGTNSFDCDSFWDSSKKLSISFNKTLGLMNLNAYLVSSNNIAVGQTICTLPAECRPNTTISIKNAGYIASSTANSSPCTLSINTNGVLSISSALNTDINPTSLYMNVTLACAGWGNGWPGLNQI